MANISSQGNRHDATFAGHEYRIIEGKETKVLRLVNGEQVLVANRVELQSLMNFFYWHKRSKRQSSELPVLVPPGTKGSD